MFNYCGTVSYIYKSSSKNCIGPTTWLVTRRQSRTPQKPTGEIVPTAKYLEQAVKRGEGVCAEATYRAGRQRLVTKDLPGNATIQVRGH